MSAENLKQYLIGREITGYQIAPDGREIRFSFTDGPDLELSAYGDCCSISWVESIDLASNLFGTVQEVHDMNMPELGEEPGQRYIGTECVQYYGLMITTEKGSAIIDYRNDSNGYYGGDLVLKEYD